MSTPPNFAALRYYAEEELRSAMQADGNDTLRHAVTFFVQAYAALVDQAGKHAASLIESLPYAKEVGGYRDAYIGLSLLTETRDALREILFEDAEMHGLIEGFYTTNEEEDRDARLKARQYDLEHHSDKQGVFREGAREYSSGRPTDDDIADSAANGSRQELDAAVEAAQDRNPSSAEIQIYETDERRPLAPEASASPDKSASRAPAERLEASPPDHRTSGEASASPERKTDVAEAAGTRSTSSSPAPAHNSSDDAVDRSQASGTPPQSTISEPEDPALRLFGERPVRITVTGPDYSRETPAKTFRASTQWLIDHIIMVASGSKSRDAFPRIAPLISAAIPLEYAVSVRELTEICRELRTNVAKLRVPDDGGRGVVDRILSNLDPNDPHSMMDAMKDMLGLMNGRDPHRPDWADSARNDGGWKEGDGDSWK